MRPDSTSASPRLRMAATAQHPRPLVRDQSSTATPRNTVPSMADSQGIHLLAQLGATTLASGSSLQIQIRLCGSRSRIATTAAQDNILTVPLRIHSFDDSASQDLMATPVVLSPQPGHHAYSPFLQPEVHHHAIPRAASPLSLSAATSPQFMSPHTFQPHHYHRHSSSASSIPIQPQIKKELTRRHSGHLRQPF